MTLRSGPQVRRQGFRGRNHNARQLPTTPEISQVNFHRFLDLPDELRYEIYKELLTGKMLDGTTCHPILLVSRKIHEEAFLYTFINGINTTFKGLTKLLRQSFAKTLLKYCSILRICEEFLWGPYRYIKDRTQDNHCLWECLPQIKDFFSASCSVEIDFMEIPDLFQDNSLSDQAAEAFAYLNWVSKFCLYSCEHGVKCEHPLTASTPLQSKAFNYCAFIHAMTCYRRRHDNHLVKKEVLLSLYENARLVMLRPDYQTNATSVFQCGQCKVPHTVGMSFNMAW